MKFNGSEDTTAPGYHLAVIQIEGRLVAGKASADLFRQVDDHLKHGRVNLILDLRELGYVDTSGLGELVRCVKRVGEASGYMVLIPSREIREFLCRFRLDMVFNLQENLADAYTALGRVTNRSAGCQGLLKAP